MSVARVEPLTTARALRGPFDYSIPERLAGIEVGDVLQIPFGPRRILGVRVSMGLRANQVAMWTDLATASDARRDLSSASASSMMGP